MPQERDVRSRVLGKKKGEEASWCQIKVTKASVRKEGRRRFCKWHPWTLWYNHRDGTSRTKALLAHPKLSRKDEALESVLHLVIVWVAFGKTQIKAQMHVEDAGTSAPGIRLSAKCIPCSWMAGPSWKGIHVAHCMAAEPPGPREHCGEKELHVLKLSFWFFPFYLEAHVTFWDCHQMYK